MHDGHLGLHAFVGQVQEEGLELHGGEHALVGDGACGQGREVDAHLMFHTLADAEGLTVERNACELAFGIGHDQGLERGHAGKRLQAESIGVRGHCSPGKYLQPLLFHDSGDGLFLLGAGALLILACQWGLYLEASALRNAYHLLVLNGTVPYVASVTAAGVCRQQGTAEGFYRLCSKPDPARRWQNYALPLVLATAAVLSGVVCFSGGNMSDFPWVLTALTTAGAGLGIPLSGALPMYYLSRRLSRSGCAAAGYAGAKAVSRPRRLVLTDDDLFPAGTVTLNGYKVFGEERSRAVSYAASVARAAGSSLTPLLERQLTAEGGFRLPVEWVNYCEEGGVEANIRGETVLMGSAYFMKKRKVALPRDMKLSTGVFLAVDGALTAVFAVKYQPSRNAEWALRTLKRFHIVPVLAVRSGNVTPGLIKRKFGVDAKPVYPDVSTRLALAQLAEQQGEQPCVAICREGLMPLVESVAGSRRAVKAVRTATILSYIGAAAGVALAYYLTSVGNFALLTPIAMVLYQVLWLLPTLLLAGLVKHY